MIIADGDAQGEEGLLFTVYIFREMCVCATLKFFETHRINKILEKNIGKLLKVISDAAAAAVGNSIIFPYVFTLNFHESGVLCFLYTQKVHYLLRKKH